MNIMTQPGVPGLLPFSHGKKVTLFAYSNPRFKFIKTISHYGP